MLRRAFLCYIALLAACGHDTRARDTTTRTSTTGPLIQLANGLNSLDLLGDGTKSQAFVAWRGNYNGHGFSSVAFYLFAKSDLGDSTGVWQIVPFFGGPQDGAAGRETYRTSEGADCTLGDIRVLRHPNAPVEIILAHRELGTSFADSAAVRFDYYKLSRNLDGLAGWPPFYFELSRSLPAKRQYCDVNEAFQRELTLGATGLGRGEGGR